MLVVLLASLALAAMPVSRPIVPPPPEYQFDERAWLKEDDAPPETWHQYDDTGSNRLNLTYRYSQCNMAYVAKRNASAGSLNVTFIVYHNSSLSSGFNRTGHLFPGSQPNWSLTVPLHSSHASGEFTYNLFVTTFDPQGVPGEFQVRINTTDPLLGSSWTSPDGNPNVPWMFFHVPTSHPSLRIVDQLSRSQPFYIDGPSPSTVMNLTFVIDPPGNSTGSADATVTWLSPAGLVIMNHTVPVMYEPRLGWWAQDIVKANASAFPANATHPYSVQVRVGYFSASLQYVVLSTQWVKVKMDVNPRYGQWFDPSSFEVSLAIEINTGFPNNPYAEVGNLTMQLWNLSAYLGFFANLSWNISGYPVIPGSSYTYTWTGTIPANLIDPSANGSQEFFGYYKVLSVPTPGLHPALMAEKSFYVDDPLEIYSSLNQSSGYGRSAFQAGDTIWVNVELDPTFLRTRQNQNEPYSNTICSIIWDWPDPPPDYVKAESVTATKSAAWHSSQYWAFSTIGTNTSTPDGIYRVRASTTCNSGYVVWDWQYCDILGSYTPPVEDPPYPPYTTISPPSSQEWRAITEIKLYSADPFPGTGVKAIYCQIDNGPVQAWPPTVVYLTGLQGSHTYTYWSEDNAGNIEMPKTALVKIDTLPPRTTIYPTSSNDVHPPPLFVQLQAFDPHPGSGIHRTYYMIDSSGPMEYPPDGFLALEGDHVYSYWSVDRAGNCEAMREAWIRVAIRDSAAPIMILSAAVVIARFFRGRTRSMSR